MLLLYQHFLMGEKGILIKGNGRKRYFNMRIKIKVAAATLNVFKFCSNFGSFYVSELNFVSTE